MSQHSAWGRARFLVHRADGSTIEIKPSGRERWALEALIAAGDKGCTPIDTPAARWAAYVHDLRGMGAPIETLKEAHGGPFAGRHARYVLRGEVLQIEEGRQ
jgi:hypothetical protein